MVQLLSISSLYSIKMYLYVNQCLEINYVEDKNIMSSHTMSSIIQRTLSLSAHLRVVAFFPQDIMFSESNT